MLAVLERTKALCGISLDVEGNSVGKARKIVFRGEEMRNEGRTGNTNLVDEAGAPEDSVRTVV